MSAQVVIPVTDFQSGNSVSSKRVVVTSLDLGDADVNAWSGRCYGFMIQPTGLINTANTSQSPYVYMKIRGMHQKSNDIVPIVPNQFYRLPCEKIDFCGDPAGLITVEGEWIVTVALQPYAVIHPSANPLPFTFPAQSGGFPSLVAGGETQALTRAAPTLITEGTAIGLASMFYVLVKAAAVITAGTVDLYRTNSFNSAVLWDLVAQGIALPTGAKQVRIPVDRFGPHTGVERFLAAANGVIAGAETSVEVYWLFQ